MELGSRKTRPSRKSYQPPSEDLELEFLILSVGTYSNPGSFGQVFNFKIIGTSYLCCFVYSFSISISISFSQAHRVPRTGPAQKDHRREWRRLKTQTAFGPPKRGPLLIVSKWFAAARLGVRLGLRPRGRRGPTVPYSPVNGPTHDKYGAQH